MARLWPLVSALALCSCQEDEVLADRSLIHTVQRGDLEISVREQGELQAARETLVASEYRGKTVVIFLIDEGSVVEEGEILAELDTSDLENRRDNQVIEVATMQSSLEQARKNFEIVEEELRANARRAESQLTIAELELEKLLGQPKTVPDGETPDRSGTNQEMVEALRELLDSETAEDPTAELKYGALLNGVLELLGSEGSLQMEMGEMANDILLQIDQIALARADLKLAAETLEHSQRLYDRDFITKNELERDQISYRRQLSSVTVAWNNLQLLVKYTLPARLITLQQNVDNAHLDLKSVLAANEARRVREEAELTKGEEQFKVASRRLRSYDQQMEAAIIRAPTPGLVVYAQDAHDWDEMIMEGMTVRERQIIISLPDVSKMVVNFHVHEAQIDKIAVDQPAIVSLDAFPERPLTGRVTEVSSLPDSSSRWNNQDLKVYRCAVMLDEENTSGRLRPGMSATVHINVGVLEDVVNVPLTALKRRGDAHFVWKATSLGPVAVQVELGGNTLTHVEILSGLAPGDEVHLVQPPGLLLPAPEGEGRAARAGAGVESGSRGSGSTGAEDATGASGRDEAMPGRNAPESIGRRGGGPARREDRPRGRPRTGREGR